MENAFGIGAIVAIIYILLSVIESRFIKKDGIAFKAHIKNAILVFISTVLGIYIINSIGEQGETASTHIAAFTGAPGF